jgi:hypothetical protein
LGLNGKQIDHPEGRAILAGWIIDSVLSVPEWHKKDLLFNTMGIFEPVCTGIRQMV